MYGIQKDDSSVSCLAGTQMWYEQVDRLNTPRRPRRRDALSCGVSSTSVSHCEWGQHLQLQLLLGSNHTESRECVVGTVEHMERILLRELKFLVC